MMKGISPIIATVIVLLITVSIAGAAWIYISAYWTGVTAVAIETLQVRCLPVDNTFLGYPFSIVIKNSGTQAINIKDGGDIRITRTGPATSAPALYGYKDPTGVFWNGTWPNATAIVVGPGQTGEIIDSSANKNGRYTYSIIPTTGRTALTAYADCTGR